MKKIRIFDTVLWTMCGLLYVFSMTTIGLVGTLLVVGTPMILDGGEWIHIRRGGEVHKSMPLEKLERRLRFGIFTSLATIIVVSIAMIILGHNPLYPIIPIENLLP